MACVGCHSVGMRRCRDADYAEALRLLRLLSISSIQSARYFQRLQRYLINMNEVYCSDTSPLYILVTLRLPPSVPQCRQCQCRQ